jgi:hypothetical protein
MGPNDSPAPSMIDCEPPAEVVSVPGSNIAAPLFRT